MLSSLALTYKKIKCCSSEKLLENHWSDMSNIIFIHVIVCNTKDLTLHK